MKIKDDFIITEIKSANDGIVVTASNGTDISAFNISFPSPGLMVLPEELELLLYDANFPSHKEFMDLIRAFRNGQIPDFPVVLKLPFGNKTQSAQVLLFYIDSNFVMS